MQRGACVSVDVNTEIVIDRPVGIVAGFAADPTNAPEWYANIDSVEWQTPRPVSIGSAVTFVARILDRRRARGSVVRGSGWLWRRERRADLVGQRERDGEVVAAHRVAGSRPEGERSDRPPSPGDFEGD